MESLSAMAGPVGELLRSRGETIAVAESSAGGLVSAALLSIPGASAWFLGGGVIYTQQARGVLAGIGDDEMRGLRASTETYARLLAARTRERLGAVWGLAETGAAGPTGNRYGDAAGHTCLAVVGPVELATTLETGEGEREANMWRFTRAALELLEQALRRAG